MLVSCKNRISVPVLHKEIASLALSAFLNIYVSGLAASIIGVALEGAPEGWNNSNCKMRHKTNGNTEGGRELASGVFQSQVIWGYISCSTGRKKTPPQISNKGKQWVWCGFSGGWSGRNVFGLVETYTEYTSPSCQGLGEGIKYFARHLAISRHGQWPAPGEHSVRPSLP